MQISQGCFIVRPSAVQSANMHSVGGGPQDVLGSVSERSDSVGIQGNRGKRESVDTPGANRGTKMAVHEAGQGSTEHGNGKKNLPGGERYRAEAEIGIEAHLVELEKRLTEARNEGVEATDEATTGSVDTTVREHVKSKHSLDRHKAENFGVGNIDQLRSNSEMEHDTNSQADDSSIEESWVEGLKSERSSSLGKLLLDMTRAAGALGTYLPPAGAKEKGRPRSGLGLTAIVVLDRPLFIEHMPGKSAQTKTSSVSLHAPTPKIENQQHTDGLSETSHDTLEDAHFTVPRENDREDQRGQRLMQANDIQTRSKNRGSTASRFDQHPAGLGDPTVALEALLSWIRDGPAPGCQGRREVLLVCGSSDASNETVDRENEVCVQRGDASSSRMLGEINKNNLEQNRESAPHQSGSEEGAEALERVPSGGDEKEIACNSTSGIDNASEQAVIRQIILGGGITPTDTRSSRISTRLIPQTAKHVAEGTVVGDVNVRPSVLERADSNSLLDRDGKGTSPSNKHPNRVLLVGEESLVQSPCRPTEVLLDIRRLSTDDSGPRVIAAFPPPRALSVPLLTRGSIVPPHEFADTKPKISRDTHFPTKHDICIPEGIPVERPRVIVGPVVGRVSPTSAVVLVEVGEISQTPGSAVGVALIDTLSGQRFEITGGVETGSNSNCPRVFEFEGLTPGRRYVVRLVGVRQKDQVSGVLQTSEYGCNSGTEFPRV